MGSACALDSCVRKPCQSSGLGRDNDCFLLWPSAINIRTCMVGHPSQPSDISLAGHRPTRSPEETRLGRIEEPMGHRRQHIASPEKTGQRQNAWAGLNSYHTYNKNDKYTLKVLQIQGTSQHHNATVKHGLKPKDYVNILRI